MMNWLRGVGRALLLFLVRLCYARAPQPAPSIDIQTIKKVLLVRTDTRVGNVLLTTPLLRALRQGLPWARVDFLVAAGKQQLVEGLAGQVWPFAKRDFFRAPWRFWSFLFALRRQRYDLVVEAGHWHAFSFTSLWLTRFIGAPMRIGHKRGLSDYFLTHAVQKCRDVSREVPSKLELLKPLRLPAVGEHLQTTVDQSAQVSQAAQQIIGLSQGSLVVSLNPGARKLDHRWPSERFGALAKRLRQELGLAPLVLWGPGEESVARAVCDAAQGAAILAPITNLAQLAGVFRGSALVVTNDTGPMHLAAATGAPVVAVMLAEDGERWAHGGDFVAVAVKNQADQDVERVFQAAKQLLSTKQLIREPTCSYQ